jgi:mannose-6-phosphate isomerase-like protein (cupin superfamily)
MNELLPITHMNIEVIDIFVGPKLSYLTPRSSAPSDFCLMKVEMPAGVTVPVHSHEDRETFYILEGELNGLTGTEWTTFLPGMVLDLKNGVRHALRNTSAKPTTLLMVTTMKMGQFFREVGRPYAPGLPPPTPADLLHFGTISSEYGYWMGSPADNLDVGITL